MRPISDITICWMDIISMTNCLLVPLRICERILLNGIVDLICYNTIICYNTMTLTCMRALMEYDERVRVIRWRAPD